MAYEIFANADAWLATDAENLAKFLETDTGKRLIPQLAGHSPALLEKGHINAILIRSGEVRSWTGMIETLLMLAHPAPDTSNRPINEYPPLTDDKAWNDGQRLDEAGFPTETPKP